MEATYFIRASWFNRRFIGAEIVVGAIASAGVIPAAAQDFSVVSALGDSLTATPLQRGPNHAEHISDQLGVALSNLALEGETTASLLAHGQHTDAVEAGTTFAFLWIGANDILFEHTFEALEGDAGFVPDSIANWITAAETLTAAGADVITANLPDLGAIPGGFIGRPEGQINLRSVTIAVNTALQEAADQREIPVVDVFGWYDALLASEPMVCDETVGLAPAFGGELDLFFDEIHPSSYGMGLITNEFIAAMNAAYATDLVALTEEELGELAGVSCEEPIEDTDGDGVPDDQEQCPGQDDNLDTDGDNTPDCLENCPDDPDKTEPGACGCGVADVDSDKDGTFDCVDNCPNAANADQADRDDDGVGDVCDEPPPPTRRSFCAFGVIGALPFMLLGLGWLKLCPAIHPRRNRTLSALRSGMRGHAR